jgi:predicted nucleic acid-binding protein
VIVVDNSVLAGFAIRADAYHKLAEQALEKDNEWHAPELIRSEFRSVANGYLKKGESRDVVDEAASLADDTITSFHRVPHREVFDVLKEAHLSAYDAEYVALARQLGCKLVTTDKKVVDAFPTIAIRLHDFV